MAKLCSINISEGKNGMNEINCFILFILFFLYRIEFEPSFYNY